MKLAREAMKTYLDASFGGAGTPDWYLVGKDNDDMSTDLSPDVEPKKNVIGETSVEDNGYEPSMDTDPYYADTSDKLYPKLRDIALERKKGDACRTTILEVIVEDTEAEKHLAFTEDVIVKPSSYGGPTSGVSIPFKTYYAGNRKKGYVTMTNKIPTFTEGEITAG